MSCCPPSAECIQCPIIVSCISGLVLAPGQLQFCPDSCKFYFDCAGQKTCLNPTYGAGLRMTENCILQVGLAPNRPLVFDESGNIDIDCEKLVQCCGLVNQAQLASVVSNIYQTFVTGIGNIQQPKKCDGVTSLTSGDSVYQVGSIKKSTATGDANLACGDRVVLWSDLVKCVNGALVPLARGDIVMVQATCDAIVVPVGSPPAPVGSPPPEVGSPPVVGSPPPPVGGGCCDLANTGAKSYSETYVDGVYTGGVAPVWAFSYACAGNAYIPFAVAVVAGSLPPGLSVNGVDPNSDGSDNYYFQGFSGSVVVPAVTTTYTFTIKAAPFDINSSCYSLAEITYTVNVSTSAPPPVGG